MRYDLRTTSILVRFGLAATLVALFGLGVALSNRSASATGLTTALGQATPATDGSLVIDVRRGAPHYHAHFNPHVARRMHHGAYRPANAWHSRHYWGDVVAGVALGTAVGVAAAGVIPARPAPHLCWYWSNPAMTRGYWDYC